MSLGLNFTILQKKKKKMTADLIVAFDTGILYLCHVCRELQEILEYDKKELEAHCQGLEKKVQNVEADYGLKEQELKLMEEKMEQEKEELKRVAAHWNERWLDVAIDLQSTQAQLEETKKRQQETDMVWTTPL